MLSMTNQEEYIVGYLDDNTDYKDLKENLEDFVNLIPIENCTTLNDILDWVIHNQVQCLLVDHKLVNKYDFVGTDVITFFNKKIPDLPCVIVTSFKNDSIAEDLVIELLIKDRDDLPGEDLKYTEFGNSLAQACRTFKKRLEQRKQEFTVLYQKKQETDITTDEEENLCQLYNLLKAYGEIDIIPTELLTSQMSIKINSLIEKLDKIIKKEC